LKLFFDHRNLFNLDFWFIIMAKKLDLDDVNLIVILGDNIRGINRIAKLFKKKTGRGVQTYEVARVLRDPWNYTNPPASYNEQRRALNFAY